MRSPKDMRIIEIDITNACNKRCSNCTRFCGNHKKNFFMDFDTFKRALDSLDGYEGVIGIMGGEPTIHPEFERFLLHIKERFGERKQKNRMIYPQRDFIKEIRRREYESRIIKNIGDQNRIFEMQGLCLLSNMGSNYRKHYELIQDIFQVQILNDHMNSSYHQPGLIARKDLDIPDDKWIQLRDQCWVQNEWSATITPKGAFFCEIAGALDMLFDGPGGWKIEPGWWKRTPKEFGDQLHWCELCGFALKTFMRDSEEEINDVSPTLYQMLKKIDSPGLKSGNINVVNIENGIIKEESKPPRKHFSAAQPYIENYEDRFNEKNSVLFVKQYEEIYIPDGEQFGIEFNKALKTADEWIVFRQDTVIDAEYIQEIMKCYVLNPGTMHIGNGFALFSKKALSLRKFGYDRIAHTKSFEEIIQMWQPEKRIYMDQMQEKAHWKSDAIIPGKRYAVWGAGISGSFIVDTVESSGGILVFAVDRNKEKVGMDFYGVKTHAPEYLIDSCEMYDYVLIAHYSRFDEVRQEALQLGIPEDKIVMPYEF